MTGQPGQALCIFAGDMLHYKDRTLPYREVDAAGEAAGAQTTAGC